MHQRSITKLLDKGFSHAEVIAICGIHPGGNAPGGPSGGNALSVGAVPSARPPLGIFQKNFTNRPGWVGSIDGSAYLLTSKAEAYQFISSSIPEGMAAIGHRRISAEFKVNAHGDPNLAIGAGLIFGDKPRPSDDYYIFYLTAFDTAEICKHSSKGFDCYKQKDEEIKEEQDHIRRAKWAKLEVLDSESAGGVVAVLTANNWESRTVLSEPEAAAGSMGLWFGGNKNDTFSVQNVQYTNNRQGEKER